LSETHKETDAPILKDW